MKLENITSGDDVDEITRGGSFEIPEYLEKNIKTQLGRPLMTQREAIDQVKAAQDGKAGRVLCKFLTALGYPDVVDAYNVVTR